MKVAFVVTARLWGGAESQVAHLAEGLRRRGHRCRFFARHGSPLARQMLARGFAVRTFPGTGRGPLAIWNLRRQLADWSPDVLHLNDPHAVTSGGLAAWGLDIPARVAARRSIFPIRSRWRYHLFADRVICVARAVADTCRQAGLPDDRLRVVYDGAPDVRLGEEVRLEVRQNLGLARDHMLLLTVALMNPLKGHRYLIEAMPGILKRHPRAVVAFAGHGREEAPLKKLAQRLDVSRHIRWLGFRPDVPRLMSAADLFVLPSLSEGLCSSLIDAMSAGLPLVTTRVGGTGELVDVPSTSRAPLAWTVAPRDPQRLADAVIEALDDPDERARRAARARARARSRFDLSHMVESTIAVYRELLEGPREVPVRQRGTRGPNGRRITQGRRDLTQSREGAKEERRMADSLLSLRLRAFA